ncbi:MAG: metallopeptidase TldD-related protein, partial [Deltaproteobacteria bacterium]
MGSEVSTAAAALLEAGRAIARALSGEADDVEVVLFGSDERSWTVRQRELVPEVSLGQVAVGLRALRGGRLAVAATATLDAGENVRALRAALPVARAAKLWGFSTARPTPMDSADPSIAALERDPQALYELAYALGEGFRASPRAAKVEAFEGMVSAGHSSRAVVTSRGESWVGHAALTAYADVDSAHSELLHLPVASEAELERVRGLGRTALDALPDKVIGPEQLGTGMLPALLHPRLVDAILRTVLQEKLTCESAAKGLSELRAGAAVADPGFTLWDTPSEVGLSSEAPTDDEGTLGAPRPIIQGGRFTGPVGSRASCEELGIAPTGNGFRTPMIAEPLAEAPVRDRLSGLRIDPGERTVDELIRGMERGLVLNGLLGLHGADRARAAFSCTVSDGLAVRDGKILGRLAPGSWNVSGRLLPTLGPERRPGLLSHVE